MHEPVLTKEVIHYLKLRKGQTICDATLGCGGHAALILKYILPKGLLIGIDQDEEALEKARASLNGFKEGSYKIIRNNFRNLDDILASSGIKKVNGILFDLGVSTLQLQNRERGFSFNLDGPLDMRMDQNNVLSAFEVVNKYPQHQLEDIIKKYGEERYAKRIARAIVDKRRKSYINTTSELRELIWGAVGFKYRRLKIHPATRTFQAIRIEVNRELESLEEVLEKLPGVLEKKARVCIISFHSLEDRLVKNHFKDYAKEGIFSLVTKKPVTPAFLEIKTNPKARSAKMRVAELK